jgi:hypothetical protein
MPRLGQGAEEQDGALVGLGASDPPDKSLPIRVELARKANPAGDPDRRARAGGWREANGSRGRRLLSFYFVLAVTVGASVNDVRWLDVVMSAPVGHLMARC